MENRESWGTPPACRRADREPAASHAGSVRHIGAATASWHWRFAIAFTLFSGATAFSDDAPEPGKLSPEVLQRRAERLFALKVYPLLEAKCFACHGNDPEDLKGELDLTSREAMLKGGESEEPSLVPGKPAESLLFAAINWDGYEMPPKENDRLDETQIAFVRRWIASGAPWPDEAKRDRIRRREWAIPETEDGVIIGTSGGLSDEWTYRRYAKEDVWAFRPVVKPDVPAGANPVDALLGERLAEAGIEPAGEADPRTLIRRVTFDLIGLPPTPEEIDAFVKAWKEDSETAWTELVDRLLDSPHYGERWGQHWLDVVRYADTGGFSNDYERSNAWRYRDYVVRAFNEDQPFDQFVLEQLAGDELRPDDPEAVVATGFLRMGPWDTAMIPQPEARQLFLDDLVHVTGQTFLGMPMRCCRCHDHKFDPIPTRDYYRMYAAFAGTQPAEIPTPFVDEENLARMDDGREHVQRLLDFARSRVKELTDKREAAARAWYAEHDRAYKNLNARKNDPDDEKPPRHVGLTEEEQGRLKVREQDVWIWERRLERYEPMAQSVYNGPDKWTNARKLRRPDNVNQKWRPESFVHTGGALDARGPAVTPGVLSGAHVPVAGRDANGSVDPYAVSTDLVGRRLDLARWMVDPANPLTPRVFVNRLWQGHFGKGLVGTPNNFGAKGSKPTHPKLLDWLAADFVEHGWKVKRLHRLIVTSDAYRRSGRHPDREKLDAVDPNNELLAFFPPRRLTAEELRDGMLAVTGELNREVGGLPVMPEINMEVALQPRMIQFSLAPAYQPSRTPAERNRRSIYAYRVRGQADPFLEVLNLPNPNESCERREQSAVTPQAFTLFNSTLTTDRAIAFAQRVEQEADSLESRIDRAFALAFGRQPSEKERTSLAAYARKMRSYHERTPAEPVEYPTEITRSLVEEFSGKPFEYVEILPAFEKYKADAKPADVSAETRALADVCLLLLNANEFVYVY